MTSRLPIVIGGIIVAAGLALFFGGFADLVQSMGESLPQEDLFTDYLIGVAWAMFLGLALMILPFPGRDRRALTWCWFAKCVVTLGFMLISEKLGYAKDAGEYFHYPRLPGFYPGISTLGDGTQAMNLFSYLHHSVFPESFHMMKVSCSFIGLMAFFLLYRAGARFLGREDHRILYVLALWPSNIFWSSVLGKDPLVLFGISLYIFGVVSWHRTGGVRFFVPIVLGELVAMTFRIWLFSILTVPLGVFVLSRMRNALNKILFLGVIVFSLVSSMQLFQARFNIETQEELLDTTQTLSHAWAGGGSGQNLEMQFDSVGKLFLFLPLGIATALFRPLPGEVLNAFGIMAGMENLVLIVIFLQALMKAKLSDLKEPLVSWAVALVLVWSSVYGFVCYQNLGTSVRFRNQILSVVIGICLYLRRRRFAPEAAQPGALIVS